MTRKITIAGVKLEVSKNEAKEAARIASFVVPNLTHSNAQIEFDRWLLATTPEARARRIAVGKALRLKVPE